MAKKVAVSLLESIAAAFGAPTAYDGRYCIWTSRASTPDVRDSFDIRDITRQLRVTSDAVVDALPDFKPAKRGRAQTETETEEK